MPYLEILSLPRYSNFANAYNIGHKAPACHCWVELTIYHIMLPI